MIRRFYSKAILALVTVALLVPSALLLYAPLPVQAQSTATCASVVAGALGGALGVAAATKIVAVPVSAPGQEAITAVGSGSAYGNFFKDCILTPIAIRLGKAMLQNITSSIITWINSGFQGNPSFVQNLNGLVSDSVDQAIGQFIQYDLGAGFLCNSFSLQVKIALAQSYLPYNQRTSCTLTQITNNVNGFIQNDNSGGWNNWLQVTTVPQNNVYGATIEAQNELTQQIASKLGIQNQTLDWGKGFRSWDVCTNTTDGEGNVIPAPAGMSPTDPKCFSTTTKTPGTVVEGQLETTLGSGVRQLEVANDIDAIVGALTNQLMSQVITGAEGLLGAGKSSTGSFTPQTYLSSVNGQTTDPALTAAINTSIDQSVTDAGLDAVFSTSAGSNATATPATSTPPATVDQGENGQTNALTWSVTKPDPTVTASAPLDYEISLNSNYEAAGLKVTTTLRKNGTTIPFLTVFSPFAVSYGHANASTATTYISSPTDASATWSNVSADPAAAFNFKFFGTPNSNAAGTYSLESDVSDSSGNVIAVQTDSFTIQ